MPHRLRWGWMSQLGGRLDACARAKRCCLNARIHRAGGDVLQESERPGRLPRVPAGQAGTVGRGVPESPIAYGGDVLLDNKSRGV